jgi:hypothetical protein
MRSLSAGCRQRSRQRWLHPRLCCRGSGERGTGLVRPLSQIGGHAPGRPEETAAGNGTAAPPPLDSSWLMLELPAALRLACPPVTTRPEPSDVPVNLSLNLASNPGTDQPEAVIAGREQEIEARSPQLRCVGIEAQSRPAPGADRAHAAHADV